MSAEYAGDPNNYPVKITIPEDGDYKDAASVSVALEGLADRTANLADHLLGVVADDVITLPLVPLATASFTWDTPDMQWRQSSVASAGVLVFELILPKRGTLTAVQAVVIGDTGHAALPATMPKITLYRKDTGSPAAATVLDTETDASANVGAYEVAHPITIVTSEVFDHESGNRYYVTFEGEAGANSAINLRLLQLIATVDP